MSGLRENSDQICSVIQVSVKGDPDEFKNWVKNRSSKYVLYLNEEKLISYEWHFSDDGKEATLVELLVDSDGYMQRLKNHLASPIAEEIADLNLILLSISSPPTLTATDISLPSLENTFALFLS